jgi:hypothetical protein
MCFQELIRITYIILGAIHPDNGGYCDGYYYDLYLFGAARCVIMVRF